jgi:hypothetical protein
VPAPPVNLYSFSFLPSPSSASPELERRRAGRVGFASPAPLPSFTRALWQIIIPPFSHPQFPGRYLAPPPVMAAGHLWQAACPSVSTPLSLSPCRYIRLSSSSRFPLCSHIASTRAWASFHHRRHLGSAIAVGGAHVAGEEPALPSFLFLWICTSAAESSLPQVHTLGTLLCCTPVRSRSATEPPQSLILATAVSSTQAISSSSSLSGEQHFAILLCPARSLQHRHSRAGEPRAAPFWCRPPWMF